MVLSPFNAWVVLKGLETLGIRMQAQSERALALAQWLETQPGVARVYYPGLASHPQHALAMRQQSACGGRGGVVRRAGDDAEARARQRLCRHRSTVRGVLTSPPIWATPRPPSRHPASTSHGRLTEAQRQAAGIGQGLIRVAVGLEHIDDLKTDLARGLAADIP